jgi:2-isopropylmalate synthase
MGAKDQNGANAKAAAYVELRVNESQTLYGAGMDSNITQAAFRAVMSALARSGAVTRVNTPVGDTVAA